LTGGVAEFDEPPLAQAGEPTTSMSTLVPAGSAAKKAL
jgi:hypothetical protein